MLGLTTNSGGWSTLLYDGATRPTDRFSLTTEDDEFVPFLFADAKEVKLNAFILEAKNVPIYFIVTPNANESQSFENKYVYYLEAYEKIIVDAVEIRGIKLLVPSGTSYFIEGLFL